MELAERRWIGRFVRLGLIVLTIILVVSFVSRRIPRPFRGASVQREAPSVVALTAGDVQIVSIDSSVDLVLQGDKILAGLSPYMIAKVRAEIATSGNKDTTGLGGSIAQMVKSTVANAIGMHVSYPVADVREIRYQDGRIIIERKSGGQVPLFENSKINGRRVSEMFREDDARRFIEAVQARQDALGTR
jgi:hypothetical protein